jgi:flagellar hook-length control protein FliK
VPAVTDEAQPLPPVVEKLAKKLVELAETLAPKAPELAQKLEAFASKLAAGEVAPTELAKLGLDPTSEAVDIDLVAAIERLLAPRAEAKPVPQPTPFAAASLVLPDLGASGTGKSTAPIAGRSSERAEPSLRQVDDSYQSPEPARAAATDRTEKPESQPNGRGSFHAAFQASLNAPDTAAAQASAPVGVAIVGTAVAADTRAMHAAYRAPVQQINMPQMAVEIVRQVEAGNSRFQIRLDPPELGRIDVKLDVDKAGNVNARLTVERAETLDLMQRDQRALEKALAQAGLDSSKTNLEFSLRQNPFGRDGQQQQQGGNGQPAFPRFGVAEADDAIPAPHVTAYRGHASASGVNLFV